jgi:hypothetical protein
MPRYLIRRDLGDLTEAEFDAAAETSTRVREERFSDIAHERSHVVRGPDGVVAYCVYVADDERRLREHAAASGIPIDEVLVIERELVP